MPLRKNPVDELQELPDDPFVSLSSDVPGQAGSPAGQLTRTDGDQNFFPVYEPDADAIKKKYREAEEAARAHHYDSTKEGTAVPPSRPRMGLG